MKLRDAKKKNRLLEGSSASSTVDKAEDLPVSGKTKYVCRDTRKDFNYSKALEKHVITCKGSPTVSVQIEAQEDILKDAVHCTQYIKEELGVLDAPLDETMSPPNILAPKRVDTINSAVESTEVYFDELMPLEKIKMNPITDGMHMFSSMQCSDASEADAGERQLQDSANNKNKLKQSQQKKVAKSAAQRMREYRARKKQLPEQHARATRTKSSQNIVDPMDDKCEFCGAIFAEPSLLEQHRSRHLEVKNQRSHQCHICFKSYKNREGIRSHLVTHTSRHKCEHCNKNFQAAHKLEDHIRRHLDIKPHQCSVCNASFVSVYDLKKHTKIHSTRTNTFLQKNHANACHICLKSYKSRDALRVHLITHTPRFKCKYCRECMQSAPHLERHEARHHGIKRNFEPKKEPIPGPPFKCTFCTKTYPLRQSLKQHLNKHTSRFECEHCSKQCISASQLKSHISGHLRLEKKTTAKNYKCNQTKNPVTKNETVEPYDAVSIVHMEAQDNVLKDAVCFDDEQEYKPIVNTSTLDKITGVELYDSETENGSAITPGQKNHIVKIEKTELDEIIDPTHIDSETKSNSDETHQFC